LNTYGKTWHTWHTRDGVKPGDRMPLGPATLAWSFSRDGEVRPELVEERDRRMDISTEERRRDRADLVELARPQDGVDTLRRQFPAATPIPGVVDRSAAATPAPVAMFRGCRSVRGEATEPASGRQIRTDQCDRLPEPFLRSPDPLATAGVVAWIVRRPALAAGAIERRQLRRADPPV